MKNKNIITTLVILITLISAFAASMGIFSSSGTGEYKYQSIRGKSITIYGKGIYRDMSKEVAPQGIAQDYVTLFAGIPLLIISLVFACKGSVRGKFLLAGTLGYFLVTYLFYMTMGMYNVFYLGYVSLLGLSFFAFYLVIASFDINKLPEIFSVSAPHRFAGGFLIFCASCIAFLWLGIVIPPLIDGSIVPIQVEHYTTLIVQGFDLSLLHPIAFVSGFLFLRKKNYGYLLAPVYLVFLSILMTALTAKVIAMGILGYNVIPVIFIIPVFNLTAIIGTFLTIKGIKENRE